jgi:hypothetical protein
MPAMGRSATLVFDEERGEVATEVNGANHAAEAERIARAWNVESELNASPIDTDEPDFVMLGGEA